MYHRSSSIKVDKQSTVRQLSSYIKKTTNELSALNQSNVIRYESDLQSVCTDYSFYLSSASKIIKKKILQINSGDF